MQSDLNRPPDLRMVIDGEHEELLRLRKRQYAIEALVGEIERVTRGQTFDIHNDIRWVQMLDYREEHHRPRVLGEGHVLERRVPRATAVSPPSVVWPRARVGQR